MKKIIYITILAFAASLTISSCTEEEVKPATTMNGGGAGLPAPK
ncbi:MAG TPA: hypothetical protein VK666_00970 [Chryseolinea sp.]|nr:hypothetical protein [Chryseolinea sp.]